MSTIAPPGMPPASEPNPPQPPMVAGPITQHTRWRLGLKAYGIVFLVVVALLLGLSVAAYQKVFTPVVLVSLETNRIGSQLQESSDVKIRGLIVGEVRDIEVTPDGARLGLALQPEQVAKIPSNVTARLLPKTLFGERYVDLVIPDGATTGRSIAEGDVITQDRTRVSIELEQVFDNLYPLLRTVQPAKLATTLNALATTLDGRGDAIGENLEVVNDYFTELNPKMPVIQQDISLLADTVNLYARLAPDLFRMTESLRVTNRTIVEKHQEIAAFFVGTAGFANTTAGFLRDNEERIIQVGQVNRPTLQLLSRYSPIYPCFASALVNWLPRINGAWANGNFHITLEVVPPREPYHDGEQPQWLDNRGPHCAGLPSPSGSQADPYDGPQSRDGSEPARESALHAGLPAALLGGGSDSGTAGTLEEQQLVSALLARDDSARPSSIQTLLAGPLMRGTLVSNR